MIQVNIHGSLRAIFLNQRPKWHTVCSIAETGKAGVVSPTINPPSILISKPFRRFGVFKAAIPNQFSIQSAIDAVIYFLKKNSIHAGVQDRTPFAWVDRDLGACSVVRGRVVFKLARVGASRARDFRPTAKS